MLAKESSRCEQKEKESKKYEQKQYKEADQQTSFQENFGENSQTEKSTDVFNPLFETSTPNGVYSEKYKLPFEQTNPLPDSENDDILLDWGNPSCFRTTYEFSQARDSDLDLDCELAEDCSIPGPGVATISAIVEQQNTGNIIDSPVTTNVKKIITNQQISFLANRSRKHFPS